MIVSAKSQENMRITAEQCCEFMVVPENTVTFVSGFPAGRQMAADDNRLPCGSGTVKFAAQPFELLLAYRTGVFPRPWVAAEQFLAFPVLIVSGL